MVFDHQLEWGQYIWNTHLNYMENAIKLFSQVYAAQSFQVKLSGILHHFITDSIRTINFYLWCIKLQQTKMSTQISAIPYVLYGDLLYIYTVHIYIKQCETQKTKSKLITKQAFDL